MQLPMPAPQRLGDVAVALAAAYLLALPLGWEAKVTGKLTIGLRTLPLVSVGACGYLLIARFLYESGVYDASGQARALRGLMTGIGFVGGGAILKRPDGVRGVAGVATAASIWSTGAIGASVAHGYYSIALALAVTTALVSLAHELPGRTSKSRAEATDERA